ncbi:sigma-54 interaction domain-containing protein [Desulfotomaculum copahuensis]|uniref:Sigma-54-dependent Fis family transcriptional regulator n=1 Tax=Desulfotomaculum copahuensis TaxID=1838280 RepID=A0A1B7LAM0_9FIRM|nr:sigma 54-interacting transcriptional regulator [Desulfotomaculum copahuensis]OAT79360.1 sigma-54-dependent Fis family transcriptional regulator [Desulfotomaculum copahuensis]
MSRLAQVKTDCQRVAGAIAAALGVEVEVIDLDLVRVAGTGKVRNDVGSRLQRGLVNKHVLEHGRPIFIQEAGYHAICRSCPLTGSCFYKSCIVYPVMAGETIAGTISLIAFNGEQKSTLCSRIDSLMEFIGRMADLIGSKVQEQEAMTEKIIMAGQVNAVMNAVDEGVIAVDGNGLVTHFNLSAERMFHIPKDEILNRPLEEHLTGLPLLKAMHGVNGTAARECFVHARGRKLHLLVTVKPVLDSSGRPAGVVASARDFRETQKLAYEIMSAQKALTLADIVGESPAMLELKARAAKIAGSDSTVLITGESGTGKEIFARAIHAASPRHNKPFVAINCGAIPETLLESELFGYEEGAFTGARRGGKPGKFELANHGTIFLDEIGNMSLYLQAKLLRVLQERQIERVGGSRLIPVDIRVIAATNGNLSEMIAGGHFRDDLYYRLSVIPLTIPPLRERPGDTGLLLEHYRRHYSTLLNKGIKGFAAPARRACLDYSWPGNVRELINAVEYAVNLEEGEFIAPASLPVHIREAGRRPAEIAHNQNRWQTIEQMEKEAIAQALEQFGWTEQGKSEAARVLGISRATIYRKISRYNLTPRQTRGTIMIR